MKFMPLSQFVAVWLKREVHSIVLRAITVPSSLNEASVMNVVAASFEVFVSHFFVSIPNTIWLCACAWLIDVGTSPPFPC